MISDEKHDKEVNFSISIFSICECGKKKKNDNIINYDKLLH